MKTIGAKTVWRETPINENYLEDLFDGKAELVIFKNFIEKCDLKALSKEVLDLEEKLDSNFSLRLDDGNFFPLPYSTIRQDGASEDASTANYKDSAKSFQFFLNEPESALKNFKENIESYFQVNQLDLPNDLCLLPFAARVLHKNKNGIDIHCENAFLNQLGERFKFNMQERVDVENALSFFVVLSAPKNGGDLILYNHSWESVKIELNQTNYFERHDANGSIFTNRGFTKPKCAQYQLKEGDAVLFRAAQIWHAITPLEGDDPRLSLGCFLAKGKDGNVYYWA